MILFFIWLLVTENKRLKEDRAYWQKQYQFVVSECAIKQRQIEEMERGKLNGTPLQAELEEIKAEIDDMINNEYCGDGNDDELITYGLKLARQKLDNHINQADCNNDCEHCEWVECPKD